MLHATSSTLSSIQLQWKAGDSGGAPLLGFILSWRRDISDIQLRGKVEEWKEQRLSADDESYQLSGLKCGTPYELYMSAWNSISSGKPSAIIKAKTNGTPPRTLSQHELISLNNTQVILHLPRWKDGGCPITSFAIYYKPNNEEWITCR